MGHLTASVARLLLLALLASGCTGSAEPEVSRAPGDGATSPDAPAPGAAGPTDPAATRVPALLRFEGTLVGGGTIDGAELAGRPVAAWFWAPW
jgi:hypothetical protein